MNRFSINRRDFVRLGAGAAAAASALNATILTPPTLPAQTPPSMDRKIRFVSIGTGIRGCDLLRAARDVADRRLASGTADLYDMHQRAGIEAYGSDLPTTKDLSLAARPQRRRCRDSLWPSLISSTAAWCSTASLPAKMSTAKSPCRIMSPMAWRWLKLSRPTSASFRQVASA